MNQEVVSLLGLITSLTSIVFAFLAFKRSEKHDIKKEGKNEGLILSDIFHLHL